MTTNAFGENVDRWQRTSLIVGIAASVVCILGALNDPAQFFRAYVFAYLFVLGLSLGGLALVMIHCLTGGAWGLAVRRFAEAQMSTLPLVALLFLPIAFGLPHIYAWASAYSERPDTPVHFWARYLDPQFVYVRAIGYFVIWLVLVALMRRWSRLQDDSPDARSYWAAYKSSGPGLVLLGLTLHFAVIDWIMSLQPGFTSTILGPLVFSSQLLSSYALCVCLFCWFMHRAEFESLVSGKVMNDLGGLLFTLLGLWAYMSWFQFMLIWLADLPRDNIWYRVRWTGFWRWLAVYLVVVHFAVPFVLLLFRAVKQSRRMLGAMAAIIFVGQWIYMYYQVMPAFDAPYLARHWIGLLMPLGLAGIWFACVLWLLQRRPLVPLHDLNFAQADHLRELDFEEAAREETMAHA